jgi:hypothetical protein
MSAHTTMMFASSSLVHTHVPRAPRCTSVVPAVSRIATSTGLYNSKKACLRHQTRGFRVRAAAAPETSTVSIITQGRHVEVTEALRKYVVSEGSFRKRIFFLCGTMCLE